MHIVSDTFCTSEISCRLTCDIQKSYLHFDGIGNRMLLKYDADTFRSHHKLMYEEYDVMAIYEQK
jgi:hypothetical protein